MVIPTQLPAVAARDSRAPSGRVVRVTVAEARLALSTSLTVVLPAITIAPASSVKLALVSIPAGAPLRSTTGGWLVLNVTLRAGPPPNTALQGLVVPVHVDEPRALGALHPANVDVPLAVAVKVTVAPLSDDVMLGEHVLVTVCDAIAVPVPPHGTGAFTVPVLGVMVTEPPPLPAKVRISWRAAATYGPTNGPPLPTGAEPAGWIGSVDGSPSARARLTRPLPVSSAVPAGSELRARRPTTTPFEADGSTANSWAAAPATTAAEADVPDTYRYPPPASVV